MEKRRRGRRSKGAKLTIEQNVPAEAPESHQRPQEEEPSIIKEETIDSNMDEVVAELNLAPRDILCNKVKKLSHDIDGFEPHSLRWCEILEEIGDLKRKIDKLK